MLGRLLSAAPQRNPKTEPSSTSGDKARHLSMWRLRRRIVTKTLPTDQRLSIRAIASGSGVFGLTPLAELNDLSP
jgi:hypothetical protein